MDIKPIKKEQIDTLKDLIRNLDDSFAFFTTPLSSQIKKQKESLGNISVSFFDLERPVEIDDEHREEFDELNYKDMQNLTLLTEIDFLSDISYEVRTFHFDPETNERVDNHE